MHPKVPRGVRVRLTQRGIRPDAILFGESQSRYVVSMAREEAEPFLKAARRHQIPCMELGEVGGNCLEIGPYLSVPLEEAHTIWKGALRGYVGG